MNARVSNRPAGLKPALVGPNLRRLRERRDLTMSELAERSGIRYQLIEKWETGYATARGPQARMIPRLAKGLGMSTEELIAELARSGPDEPVWTRGPGGVMRLTGGSLP